MKEKETVTFKGVRIHTNGLLPQVGQLAPDFTAVNGHLRERKLSDYRGCVVVLNVFPSLDTDVCATSVRKFNEMAIKNEGVFVLSVSMDLPFAQRRFCTSEGLDEVIPLSLFRSEDFASRYGLILTDGVLKGMAARAVFVLDKEGKILYRQLVDEITEEPNYSRVLEVLKQTNAGVASILPV